MRTLLFLLAYPLILLRTLSAACPSPLNPLPQLPVPVTHPPFGSCSGVPSPIPIAGYLPITFVYKDTGTLSASEIYITILVNSSTQYLSFSKSAPFLATISNFKTFTYLSAPYTPPSSPSSPQYTYKLSEFMTAPDTYTFYIPNDGDTGVPGSNVMKSSRILISLKEPLTYLIDNTGAIQFPSEFDPTSDTYYILNDKIEFDLGSNKFNRLNLNLTGVDFFGLPILVQANYKFFKGTSFTPACAVTGMPTDVRLTDVITNYKTAQSSLQPPFDTHWKGLIATYTNPASAGGADCDLRIYAPATAMGSTQKQTNPTPVSFPTDYFLSSASSPDTCTWFNAVWSGTTLSGAEAFYQNRKPSPYLVLDATTKAGAAIAKGYEVEDGSFRFKIYKKGAQAGTTITFPKPTSSKAFFTGAISDYAPPISSNASSDTQKQVFKVFATSIIAGFFPINCMYPKTIEINSDYVQKHSSEYFQNNAILTAALKNCPCVANVPWYDFYSRTLLTIGSPNLFYTSAYSDFLGTDGTIVIVSLGDNNADAAITVNLGDCSTDINFPDPYNDTTTFNITMRIPATITTVEFSTTGNPGSFTSVIPPTADGDAFFLRVTYNAGIYSGQSFVTQIAPTAQIFHPILPGQGTITTTGTNTTVSIGASPP